jgi:TonB family protein
MLVFDEVTKVIARTRNQMATDRYRLPELNAARPINHSVIPADTQSRRLLIALAILLVVLGAVVARNSDFWFGANEVAEADSSISASISNPVAAVSVSSPTPATPVATVKLHQLSKVSPVQPGPAKTSEQSAVNSDEPVVASHRVALPPLDVEVVAGDKHSTIHPGSNVMLAEIPNDPNRPAALNTSAPAVATNASEHERLTAAATPALHQTIDATYPELGQHSRVQGSVVLEAVIGTDGVVEGLRVVSGPSILTGAAQQAVRQWRFKPYLQNGRPVETKCTVTVNFSIRVSDTASQIS